MSEGFKYVCQGEGIGENKEMFNPPSFIQVLRFLPYVVIMSVKPRLFPPNRGVFRGNKGNKETSFIGNWICETNNIKQTISKSFESGLI